LQKTMELYCGFVLLNVKKMPLF